MTGKVPGMDAAVLPEPGTPHLGSFDDPLAGDGQVVLDVLVAGLNPVDLAMAAGRFPIALPYPSVAGREGVGRTPDGRRVYFGSAVAPYGSLAPRTLVDPATLFDVPDALADDGLAVALGIAGLAAWLPLTYRAQLQPGETVLVLGATGAVGTIAVQAAKLLGAGRVVAAGRDAAGLERAARLGADATVDLGAPHDDLAQRLRDAAGGGVDVTIDPLWGAPAVAAVAAANVGARHVQIGGSASTEAKLSPDFRQTMTSLLGYTSRLVPLADQRAAYERMAAHAAAGEIVVEVERFPLAQVEEAWARQAAYPHHKLVIVPS